MSVSQHAPTHLGSEYELARHVPGIALDWLANTPDLQWKAVEGSMVFADIAGFTAMSERLATKGRIGAEELVETLSRVFGAMLDTAATRGGQLLKFGGDALLFLYDGADHAVQACSSAVEMRSELRRASDLVTSVGRLSLSLSIGVHSGDFHHFLVGEPNRELVVLGPGITRVVRCENAAMAGEIVVSEATAGRLPLRSVLPRSDGALTLRWRKPRIAPVGGTDAAPGDPDAPHRLLPAILADVLEGARPDPAHRVATIAFMRFSGTDRALARDGPDALAAQLHDTLRVAQEAFLAEDVALLCVDCDVDGAKLFCSSGVPLTSEDDEGRMLRAARAIMKARTPLPLQIGINRGHVFAAELGTARRAAYSAMGDTTNTAARICAKAPPGSVYVHPSVLEHSRTLYDSAPVGPFTFKGKAQPQLLYVVDDEVGTRPADTDPDELPLLGREQLCSDLVDRIRRSAGGTGSVVVVSGAVGLGKSRLVNAALERSEVGVFALRAEPYGSGSAFRMFRDPLRALLGIERGPQAWMAHALEQAVRRLIPHRAPLLALLADVVSIEVEPSDEVQAILPRYRPDRTADVVVDLLAACFDGPLAILVGAAHWGDDASEHLVSQLARETAARPWTVVVVRRDDHGGIDPDGADRVELRPLDDEAIRRLTVVATEAAPLLPHQVDQIVARAGGNPLFAVELIKAVQELGSVDAVPTSLQGAIAAQVDSLNRFARRVLCYASVLGRSFRRGVLAEVLRAEDIVVDEATIDGLGRFVDADGESVWRFRNGIVRDVIYDGLGYRLRARLHLEAGEAVERISEDLAADSDMLALHFAAAGDHERTYKYASLAADRADRAQANVDAALHYERALDAARWLPEIDDEQTYEMLLALGDVRERAGLLDAALSAYRSAARLRRSDLLALCELLLRRAHVHEVAGAFPVALRETTRARTLLAGSGDSPAHQLRARAAALASTIRVRQERVGDALRLAELAAAEAAECDERSAMARAYSTIAWASLVTGRGDGASFAEKALALYRELGDLLGQAHMENNLGVQAFFEGRWRDTVAYYSRAGEACRRIGDLMIAGLSDANIGEVLVNQGRIDEAEPLLRDAARLLRSIHSPGNAAFAEMHLARVLTARGQLDAAERLLTATLDTYRALGSESAFEAALHLAACLLAAGRADEALAQLDVAGQRSSEEMMIFRAATCLVVASALIELGRADEARDAIAEGVTVARERGLDFDLARLLLVAARLGEPFDPRIGTTEPAEEAQRLLDRLGVVSVVGAT